MKTFLAGKTDPQTETGVEEAALAIAVIGHRMAEEVKGNFDSGVREAALPLPVYNPADQLYMATGSSLHAYVSYFLERIFCH